MKNKAKPLIFLFSLFTFLFSLSCDNDPKTDTVDAVKIAEEAFTYGLPLVLMDVTRRQNLYRWSNMPPEMGGQKEINEFFHAPVFPDHNFRTTVRPNVDTLYSSAFLDLTGGPVKLILPDQNNRFHMIQIMDAYTNNVLNAPGTRTTGDTGGEFIIAGPDWTGAAQFKLPTNYAWVLGRTLVKSDFANVYSLIQQYTLERHTPNGALAEEINLPNISMTDDVNKVAKDMPIDVFFNYLNQLMVINPPLAADNSIVKRMATIGVAPGATFNVAQFSAKEQEAMQNIPQERVEYYDQHGQDYFLKVNGWNSTNIPAMGIYGTDYGLRASIAVPLLAANLPADAVYLSRELDATGAPLNGSKKYKLRFEAGQIPPIDNRAFWSLTLYEGNYLSAAGTAYPGAARYAVQDSFLVPNTDGLSTGSIEIYIQNDNPGSDKEINWLPAPSGDFNLTLRAYIPKPELLNGSWSVPQITTVE